MKEILSIATGRGIPVLEVMRPELDRMAGFDSVHQGVALKVPPYEYAHPIELLDRIESRGQVPLLVALDGVTDPRNLGAIIRSTAAFGGQGVIVPQRRSVGHDRRRLEDLGRGRGPHAGRDGGEPHADDQGAQAARRLRARPRRRRRRVAAGARSSPKEPVVIVVGSEGKGLSRLVTETCDAVVSIPITSTTESLNAGIAASVALYEIARLRAQPGTRR